MDKTSTACIADSLPRINDLICWACLREYGIIFFDLAAMVVNTHLDVIIDETIGASVLIYVRSVSTADYHVFSERATLGTTHCLDER